MKNIKRGRTEEIIRESAAEFIQHEAGLSSLITVTRVEMNESGKDAIIYFTTIPTNEEDTALKFLERKIGEFKSYLQKNTSIGFLPFLRFKIDFGERNRQRLDQIASEN